MWNLENMLPIQVLKRHEAGVNSVTIHEDHLLSASEDHEIKVMKALAKILIILWGTMIKILIIKYD